MSETNTRLRGRPRDGRTTPHGRWWIAACGAAIGWLATIACGGGGDAPRAARQSADRVFANLRPAVVLADADADPADPASAPRFRLRERMAHYAVEGLAVSAVRRGQPAWTRVWGEDADGRELEPETWFWLGDLSSLGATLVALRLVDEGTLGLDEDLRPRSSSAVVRRLPRAVDLRQVLGQTSGLRPAEPLGVRAETLLAEIRQATEPGTRFERSEANWALLEDVVTAASEPADFVGAFERLVLEPLAVRHGGEPALAWTDPPQGALRAARRGIGGEPIEVDPQPLAARGLWGTPAGLALLAASLVEAQASTEAPHPPLLSRRLRRELEEPGLGGWKLGVQVGDEAAWVGRRSAHGLAVAHPASGDALAVLTTTGRGDELAAEILLAVAEEFGWSGLEPERLQPRPLKVEGLIGMVGTYRFEGSAAAPAVDLGLSLRGQQLVLDAPAGFFPWEGATSTVLYPVRGGLRMLERPGEVHMSLGGGGVWELRYAGRTGRKVSAAGTAGEGESEVPVRSLDDGRSGH